MNRLILKILSAGLFIISAVNCYANNVCPVGQNSEVLCNGRYYSCNNSSTKMCNGTNLSCVCRTQ